MAARNARGESTPALCPSASGATVTVTRGWGDRRTICVPLSALRNVHWATDQGGRRRRLPRPMLAGYMWCDVVPEGAPFGHSHEHGDVPHSIKVLIRRRDNHGSIYEVLRDAAKAAKLRNGYKLGRRVAG